MTRKADVTTRICQEVNKLNILHLLDSYTLPPQTDPNTLTETVEFFVLI